MRDRARRVTKVGVAVGTALALVGVGLVLSLNAHAGLMAMFEFNRASFEPTRGALSSSPGSGTRPDYLTQTEQANPPLQPLRLQDRISMTGG